MLCSEALSCYISLEKDLKQCDILVLPVTSEGFALMVPRLALKHERILDGEGKSPAQRENLIERKQTQPNK